MFLLSAEATMNPMQSPNTGVGRKLCPPTLRDAYLKHLGGVGAISPQRYQMALELIAFDVGRDCVDDTFKAEVRAIELALPCPLD